jgi:hypothetical protein
MYKSIADDNEIISYDDRKNHPLMIVCYCFVSSLASSRCRLISMILDSVRVQMSNDGHDT